MKIQPPTLDPQTRVNGGLDAKDVNQTNDVQKTEGVEAVSNETSTNAFGSEKFDGTGNAQALSTDKPTGGVSVLNAQIGAKNNDKQFNDIEMTLNALAIDLSGIASGGRPASVPNLIPWVEDANQALASLKPLTEAEASKKEGLQLKLDGHVLEIAKRLPEHLGEISSYASYKSFEDIRSDIEDLIAGAPEGAVADKAFDALQSVEHQDAPPPLSALQKANAAAGDALFGAVFYGAVVPVGAAVVTAQMAYDTVTDVGQSIADVGGAVGDVAEDHFNSVADKVWDSVTDRFLKMIASI